VNENICHSVDDAHVFAGCSVLQATLIFFFVEYKLDSITTEFAGGFLGGVCEKRASGKSQFLNTICVS
jgi:hypothetical protein